MSKGLALSIAKTHLFAKKKQTLIASLGVMFGIAMFIVMISFMTGVNDLLSETSLTSTPHIRIYNDIENNPHSIIDEAITDSTQWTVVYHKKPQDRKLNLQNPFRLVEEIEKNPAVMGVSPQLTSQVFYNAGPIQLGGSLAGVNILAEDKLYNLKAKMRSGNLASLMSSNDGVLMGQGLADKLNVKTGDKITVATPRGQLMTLRVLGTFRFGIGTIDNTRSYANIATVQRILQKDSRYITDIQIKLFDLYQAKDYSEKFRRMFPYKAEDWETANATILISFTIRNVLTYVVVITLLVVAGFGIYNIMNMTVYDKLKDIAILKATGFGSGEIIKVFLFQAMFIGLIGGLAGLLLGFTLSYMMSQAPFDGGEFLSVDKFPVVMKGQFYIFGFAFGMVTTVLAGYFPAKKASKVDPVSILRG
ncbi:MAG: ABC transporter permease [Bacteroidia bacterium]|nr:ABC transporter permease [Bacteroidia bacterium]